MNLKVPDCGERFLLDVIRTHCMTASPEQRWTLHLYKNDYEPADGDECDTLEPAFPFEEADCAGYAAVLLDDWKDVFTNDAGRTLMMHPCISFIAESGADNDIYGYYVTREVAGDDVLVYAERFSDAPRDMNHEGAICVVAPEFAGITEF